MEWRIKHIFNFTPTKTWEKGFCHFGFHGIRGAQYVLQYSENWVGRLIPGDKFIWTAGAVNKGLSKNHIQVDLQHPHYITELPDGSLLISSNGTNKIYQVFPVDQSVAVFADTEALGLKNVGNCEFDLQGSIWVNEIEGCRVWRFDREGRPLQVLGNGQPGFQKETVPFDQAQFNWIYDLRLGPDGNIYVLDSKNYSVRRINIQAKTVELVAGTGKPGYSGDGGPALEASFGSDPAARFDGPLSLAVDEDGNLFIGDTCNHVVRMVERVSGTISTIAGKQFAETGIRNNMFKTDPRTLNLPKICSLDYYDGCLFIPDDNDDLIVLEKRR